MFHHNDTDLHSIYFVLPQQKYSKDCHGTLKSEKIFSCLNNSGEKRHQKRGAENNSFTVPQGGLRGRTTDLDFRTDSSPPQLPLQGLLFRERVFLGHFLNMNKLLHHFSVLGFFQSISTSIISFGPQLSPVEDRGLDDYFH